MDYTTLATVKTAMGANQTTDDGLISRLITAASRAIDRHCTGSALATSDNYFFQETVTNQEIPCHVDVGGVLVCWPRKVSVGSVSALAYRASPRLPWTSVDVGDVEISGGRVSAYVDSGRFLANRVQVSFSGGLATSTANLPADLVEAATILAIRYYNDAKAGENDVVGMSELGQVFYSKAIPQRVLLLLQPYRRMTPW